MKILPSSPSRVSHFAINIPLLSDADEEIFRHIGMRDVVRLKSSTREAKVDDGDLNAARSGWPGLVLAYEHLTFVQVAVLSI